MPYTRVTAGSGHVCKNMPRSLLLGACCMAATVAAFGCAPTVTATDRDVEAAIQRKQREALDDTTLPRLKRPETPPRAGKSAYARTPRGDTIATPAGLESAASSQPVDVPPSSRPASGTAGLAQPGLQTRPAASTRARDRVFTLTDALAYAQQHKRDYQTAKENLYVQALDLTLERHLWTPIFSADLRTVYGNFGEIRNFDQAMRFVADLKASQRLPYGGEFTAQMLSTLIRDVKQSITAEENGQSSVGVTIPFLRNAGHIAQEDLIQLERSLTYAVRAFERFRRQQLVDVATVYFGLLSDKQRVADSQQSLENLEEDFHRAQAQEQLGLGLNLDTKRAEQAMLQAANRLEADRESFRASADRFKLLIGMPVDEPILIDDLQSIDEIDAEVSAGRFALLRPPPSVDDESLATTVAAANRLDLLNAVNQIDDARRRSKNAENKLLPDLNLDSRVTYDTDPEHYGVASYEQARATWRSELLLSLPVERTAERNAFRKSLISIHQAERQYQELVERVRAEVRAAVNQIRLANTSFELQQRAVEVADLRRQFARMQMEQGGNISNRDKVEAENEWTDARNRLNLAKTARWTALLELRLATETLRVGEDGTAEEDSRAS